MAAESPASPQKWWQTLLTSPALLAALTGALGTTIPPAWQAVKAWSLGIRASRLQIVAEQQELWKRNIGCLRLKPVYTVSIYDEMDVGVTICEGGDILITYKRAADSISYTWIAYPTTKQPEPQHPAAGDAQAPTTQILYGATRCVSFQRTIVLWVQRAASEDERCTLASISVLEGRLLASRAAPCSVCDDGAP